MPRALLDLRLCCKEAVQENPYCITPSNRKIWRYVEGNLAKRASKKSL